MIEIVYRYDPEQPKQTRQPSTPGEARRLLESGKRTFADLLSGTGGGEPVRQVIPLTPRDIGWGDQLGVAPAQAPFAAVLGCSDARVPTEMVFQQGSNSLFVVRVAGNIVGSETLAS